MKVIRLTRPDVLLATAYHATKAQHSKEGDYNAALCIISYLQVMVSSSTVASLSFTFIARLLGHPTMMTAVTLNGSSNLASLGSKSSKQRVGSPSSTDAETIPTVDDLNNLKWLDSLTLEIGLPPPKSSLSRQSQRF